MQIPKPLSLSPARFEPCLTFAPLAWLKLLYYCHSGDTEIGGFGISAKHDLLYVEDFVTVKQQVTHVTVSFLDDAVADHFDTCVENGLSPERCGRLWIHTHPGDSAHPSSIDEATFARSFGACDWAVMMILARTGQTYARLAFHTGPKASFEIPVCVDWSAWPEAVEHAQQPLQQCTAHWPAEYAANIQKVTPLHLPAFGDTAGPGSAKSPWFENGPWFLPLDAQVSDHYPEDLHEPHDSRPRTA